MLRNAAMELLRQIALVIRQCLLFAIHKILELKLMRCKTWSVNSRERSYLPKFCKIAPHFHEHRTLSFIDVGEIAQDFDLVHGSADVWNAEHVV